jgi:hypothetical protein
MPEEKKEILKKNIRGDSKSDNQEESHSNI